MRQIQGCVEMGLLIKGQWQDKRHYYQSHQMINPTGVIPMGPVTDFATPHNRGILTDSDIMRGKNNG